MSCEREPSPAAIAVDRPATGVARAMLAMQPMLAQPSSALVRSEVWEDVRAFYERRDGRPAWIERRQVSGDGVAALAVLDLATEHGLSPDDYGRKDLENARMALASGVRDEEARARMLAEFDLGLTTSLLALGRDVAIGRSRSGVPSWGLRRHLPDLAVSLDSTPAANLENWLDTLRPRHPQYAALQAALVGLLARQPAGGSEADHGEPGASLDETNQRIRTIALNMERWRWMPDDLGSRCILVNIPSFELNVFEDGTPVLSMPVVVGKRTHQTPVFSGEIDTVVFSPYWNIPRSIAMSEIAPTVAADGDYLERNRIEVLRAGTFTPVDPSNVDWNDPQNVRGLFLRQRPGNGNALGHVKFLFPNPNNVYLHDTPADALFKRRNRALSHGCVRLQDPEAMAKYVLGGDPAWDAQGIVRAMFSGHEQFVKLAEPLPVHIAYFTAWVDQDGRVTYLPDVYDYDGRQTAR